MAKVEVAGEKGWVFHRCHSDFSSYLGARPHAVKVGVYRDIVLDLPEQAWFEDVCVRPTLSPNRRFATINVHSQTSGDSAVLQWILTDLSGHELQRGEKPVSDPETDFELGIQEPRLWWPRISRPQDLYGLEVRLDRSRWNGTAEPQPTYAYQPPLSD